MFPLTLQHRCTCFCIQIPHTYYEFNIASFCRHSSNQCSSSQIIHACHMKDARQNIQLSRDACENKHNFSEKFHVCSKKISYHNVRACHSCCRTSQLRRESDRTIITELELGPILFQPHELSIQVMIFHLL